MPNYPHHVIQRGHNRQVVFVRDEDYLYYLENLKEWKRKFGCKVHAFCLMSNHVHLIIDPGDKAENLALLMKRVAGRQTRYVNKVEGRRGTLWEGRYKSSPIDKDSYLLACCRYVEFNPVRARIVDDPGDYRWSSYRHKASMQNLNWLDEDPSYMGLGNTNKEPEKRFNESVKEFIPKSEWDIIRQAVQRGQLTGSSSFIEEVEQKIGRRVEFRRQGRPKVDKQ